MVEGARQEAEAARAAQAAKKEKAGAKVLHSASGKVLASGSDSPAIA